MPDNAYPMPGQTTMSTLAEWESYFTAVTATGVVAGLDPGLNSQARTATVQVGGAMIRGIYKPVTAVTSVTIPAPATQNRVDRLVLRLDRDSTKPEDFVKFVVVTGTPAANPLPPAIQQATGSRGMYDLPIARWISQSSGALTGLLDERVFLGTAPAVYNSQARPTPNRPTLGIETDTGRVTHWNGTTWRVVADDTGWIDLPINGPDRAAWTANTINRIRRRNGVVHMRFSVRRWTRSGVSTSDEDGSAPLVVPVGFRPGWDHFGFGYHSRSPVAVRVEAGGAVRLYPLTSDLPAGRTVSGSATWIVD
ncbi:hypothetical protein ABZ801_01005 [Actinomadura sp. NPDC047616]|uniref:hypothetical protein n=1 Tax=Actinomadura sp. NPDC047616 TaxID=3155914 RepID=UPI00340E6B27